MVQATTWTLKGQQPLAVRNVEKVNIQVGVPVAVQTVVQGNITTKTHKALVAATAAAQVNIRVEAARGGAVIVEQVNIQVQELQAAVAALRGNITTKADKALVVATIAQQGVMEAKVLEHPVRVMGIVMLGNIPLQA